MQNNKEADHLTRERILSGFMAAVKVCQVHYGGRTELATESDPRISTLCQCLEETLSHGLRSRLPNRGIGTGAIRQVTDLVTSGLNFQLTLGNLEKERPVLWWFVRQFLTKHEYERFLALRNITTDEGRGRAWLRSLLNEHSLERYTHILLSDESILEQWYETWALLRDQERSAMLPNLAGGLDSILFAIGIDNASFDCAVKSPPPSRSSKKCEPEPQVAKLEESEKIPDVTKSPRSDFKRKKKRKIPSQIVSFDDDLSSSSAQSSPSCFNTPNTTIHDEMGSVNSPSSCNSSGSDGFNSRSMYPFHDKEYDLTSQKFNLSNHEKHSQDLLSEASDSHTNKQDPSCQENVDFSSTYYEVLDQALSDRSNGKQGSFLDSSQESPSFHSNYLSSFSPSAIRSENVGTLIPFEGDNHRLVPLSPNGEALFNPCGYVGDTASLKSSSQDEFDISDSCVISNDCDKKVTESCSDSVSSIMSCTSIPNSSAQKMYTENMNFSSFSVDELRTAVLEISRTRDTSEQRRASLTMALNSELETSSTLRAQLSAAEMQHKEATHKLNSKIIALTRENELLRHQLKKYIGAVQMLSRDNDRNVEDNEPLTSVKENCPEMRDYHDEAVAYEKKLVQVAEMHGELIEFNERLQKLLHHKEVQATRLQEELIDLRGPLPSIDDEDDTNEASTSDLESSPGCRTLINIWIPTAFLSGPSSDTHHVYQIYVRIKDTEWNVYRRFAQFFNLHKQFKKEHLIVRSFDFPQKKTFGYKEVCVVEERRMKLQKYLRQLVNFLLSSNLELANQPSKATLTSALPFLLDTPPQVSDTAVESKATSKRRFLPRLASKDRTGQSLPSETPCPQYTGL